MSAVVIIANKEAFESQIKEAGDKLVVVYYSATWCTPCNRVKGPYDTYPTKYPSAIFLKIDVDECEEVALENGISALPSFSFYLNKKKIDQFEGSDVTALEEKISTIYNRKHSRAESSDVAGHFNLNVYILRSQCECLNESDLHPLSGCLDQGDEYLESDVDAQLIIAISFTQPVKIHSLKVVAPENGPKDTRLFINQPTTLDFDSAEGNTPVQEMTFTKEQLAGIPVPVQYVKFQNVSNFQMFVRNNQTESERTIITKFELIGSPVPSTLGIDNLRPADKPAIKTKPSSPAKPQAPQ